MTKDYSLDSVDCRLLELLQRDGRITNQELARRCGLSPPACHERVKRLRERGVIRGYVALIEPKALACDLLVFVEIILERTTADVFKTFSENVLAIPEVMECHLIAGRFDYLLKARFADMAGYRDFLESILARMHGVRETRTYAVVEEVKNSPLLPFSTKPVEVAQR
tara:strand:+ start:341 stop:841 length:501 start_codon:yes stop_codon:yes gene_type:complete